MSTCNIWTTCSKNVTCPPKVKTETDSAKYDNLVELFEGAVKDGQILAYDIINKTIKEVS